MREFRFLALGLVLSLSASAVALAAEEGKSTASSEGVTSSAWTDHIETTLFSNFHGPTVNFPATTIAGTYFDSDITPSYMLNGNQGLGLYVPFFYYPVNAKFSSVGDVGIKFFDKHAVSSGGLNVATNFFLQAPTSSYSQQKHLIAGLKATPAIRYSVPNSHFALGSWTEIKEYLGVNSGKQFKVWALPYASYSLAKNVELTLGYEVEWDHMAEMSAPLQMTTTAGDIQPSLTWFINKNLMFSPYVEFFTTPNSSPDTTVVGALIFAKLI